MGNDGSRVIQVDEIDDQISKCRLIEDKICPVYGELRYVSYGDIQFYLAQSETGQVPHPMSLHYLIPPNVLIVSQFTLLEDINPSSLDNLLQIISGISQMAINGGDIGIGYGRIAYAGRWGVVGEKPVNWAYNYAYMGEFQFFEGLFLSPQMMISLSQGKKIARHSVQKSDVFALGIMLVEMVFQQKLSKMFDYHNFQISLKPLLQKLYFIKQEYGDQVYQMFLSMLEIEQQDRVGFTELYEFVEEIKRSRPRMINSRMTSSNHSRDMQRGNKTPTRGSRMNAGRSPQNDQAYANNVSPFRARPNAVKRQNELGTGRTPDRNRARRQPNNISPLKRDLKINTEYGRESNNFNNYGGMRPLSPISNRR